MLVVQSALKRDFIISLFDGKTINSTTFSLVKHEGMSMYFEHDGDEQQVEALAKKTIKESEFGPALFFRVYHD